MRKNPFWGFLFGINYTPEIVHNAEDFKKLLPKEDTVPKDRFNPNYGIIMKGDKFHVRRDADLPRIEKSE